MAISAANPQRISYQEANPWTSHTAAFNKFLQDSIASQYAAPKAQADIGATRAQTGLYGAQSQKELAEAAQKRTMQMIAEQIFRRQLQQSQGNGGNPVMSGGQGAGMAGGMPGQGVPQQGGMAPQQGASPAQGNAPQMGGGPQMGAAPQMTAPQLQQQQGGGQQLSYPEAAFLGHYLGMGLPQIMDVNGQKVAVSPFGNTVVAQGLAPYQEALQKGLGAEAAKDYAENTNQLKSIQGQGLALDSMIDSVQNNPGFRDVTGPIGSFFTNWAGSPQNQELLGNLRSESGQIMLQIAPGIKGAWTGKDQNMVNGIKANPDTDFPDVFIGKLKAQKLVNRVLEERMSRANQYISQGIPTAEAHKRAAQDVPLSAYKSQIDRMVSGVPDGFVRMYKDGLPYNIPEDKAGAAAATKKYTYG